MPYTYTKQQKAQKYSLEKNFVLRPSFLSIPFSSQVVRSDKTANLRSKLCIAHRCRLELNHPMARVLVIDDEATMLQMVTELLRAAGHEVLPFNNGNAAFDALEEQHPELVITD